MLNKLAVHTLVCTALSSLSMVAFSAVITYTDRAAWEQAVSGYTIVEEGFNGSQSFWDPNSGDDSIQAGGITVGLTGNHAEDTEPTPIGVTGTGLFSGEVDDSYPIHAPIGNGDPNEIDGVALNFSRENYGFAFYDLASDYIDRDDLDTTDGLLLDATEIGFLINGEAIQLSEVIDVTLDSKGNGLVDNVPFLGFTFGENMIESFDIFHWDQIADVSGTYEEFTIDGMLFATKNVSVAEPSSIVLLALGLLGLGGIRSRTKNKG